MFLEAIDRIVATARRHDKKVGILAVDGEAAKIFKNKFDLVVMSADVRSLQAWYTRELNVARS